MPCLGPRRNLRSDLVGLSSGKLARWPDQKPRTRAPAHGGPRDERGTDARPEAPETRRSQPANQNRTGQAYLAQAGPQPGPRRVLADQPAQRAPAIAVL